MFSDGGEEGWVVDSFDATPEMSSYLVAFSLHKWNYSEVTTGYPLLTTTNHIKANC